METLIHPIPSHSPDAIAEALEAPLALLRRGEVVALPTETVYGLAGVATDLGAVAKIFTAKERPTFDPLIVHVPGGEWLSRLVGELSEIQAQRVEELIRAFWPGPLTLLLPRNAELVPDLVTSGSDHVALRSPAHPVFRALIEALDQPLAAPSANRFGRISPTRAEHVREELGGHIPMIVDGGDCAVGVESTILKVSATGQGRILRHGPISQEVLADYLPLHHEPALSSSRPGSLEAPGTMESHYAPRTPLHLLEAVPDGQDNCALLTWGHDETSGWKRVLNLSPSADWAEAARHLFGMMRELDDAEVAAIYVRALPEEGLGRAIMDRLRRAAAKRHISLKHNY